MQGRDLAKSNQARALLRTGGQSQRGASFQADFMLIPRGLDQVFKFHPTSSPLQAELLYRPILRYERMQPSRSSQLSMSRPYLCLAKLKAYDKLKRCRLDVPNVFQVTRRDGHRSINSIAISLLIPCYRTDICSENW